VAASRYSRAGCLSPRVELRRLDRPAAARGPVIKYIGSKRTLLPVVLEAVAAVPGTRTVLDLFSGTSRVGHALKRAGYRVLANDHNAYAATLARCYVAADLDELEREARMLLAELDALPGEPGWFTHTFCEQSRFFQPKNGARVDAIREAIAAKDLEPELEAVVLVALMEAADRVDSTCGLQMAYLKQWAPRAHNELALRLPELLPRAAAGKGEAHQLEALAAAQTLSADLAYIDPPYNQHSYLSNYHVWESLVLWDKPEVYGVACKRVDCRTRKSPFNSKRKFHAALRELIAAVDAKVLLVSFNNEGYIEREQMEELLSTRGRVTVLSHDYKRYVGAQIGIYNPSGEKVGAVSHLRNLEYLYVVETEALEGELDLASGELDEGESGREQLSLFEG
jgi:adenine-specific DNA-methyltransferase